MEGNAFMRATLQRTKLRNKTRHQDTDYWQGKDGDERVGDANKKSALNSNTSLIDHGPISRSRGARHM
jgi:hypothetical protein